MSRRRAAIICYHAVSSAWPTPLAVSPDRLAGQLERYARRGFVSLTFAESERRRAEGTLPERTLVITFDDAFASIASVRGTLEHFGFTATVFVVAAFVDGRGPLRWPGIDHWLETPYRAELSALGVDDLRDLQSVGWEIGSHTVTHPVLTELDDHACRAELVRSRELLSDLFGGCETVAYPYGKVDARVAALAREAGYIAGCTVQYPQWTDEPMRRPRLAASGTDSAVRDWAKLAPMPSWLHSTPIASLLKYL